MSVAVTPAPVSGDLSTTRCVSANAATCARWVTTTTWWSRGQPRQPPADLARGLPADAGVDLVEDHDRHRVGAGEHDLDGEHDARELTAGGALVHRPRRRAGVGGQQQRDLVDALGARVVGVALDGEGHRGALHRQPGQLARRPRRRTRRRRRGARPDTCAASVVDLGAGRVALGGQRLERLVGDVELRTARRAASSAQASTPASPSPGAGVLADQRGDRGAPVEHLGQPAGVGVQVGDVAGQLAGDVGHHRDGVGEVLGEQDQRGVVGGGQRPLARWPGPPWRPAGGRPRRGRR